MLSIVSYNDEELKNGTITVEAEKEAGGNAALRGTNQTDQSLPRSRRTNPFTVFIDRASKLYHLQPFMRGDSCSRFLLLVSCCPLRLRQLGQHVLGLLQVDTCVGDALTVDQLLGIRTKILPTSYQVALYHNAHDRPTTRRQLTSLKRLSSINKYDMNPYSDRKISCPGGEIIRSLDGQEAYDVCSDLGLVSVVLSTVSVAAIDL